MPLIVLVLMLTGALALFGFFLFHKNNLSTQTQTTTPTLSKLTKPHVTFIDPVRGATSAKVTIVEYGDYNCEACGQMEQTLSSVLAAHQNDVRLVWKDAPNDSLHPNASAFAVAGRCAGEFQKFWEYHDVLFANPQSSKKTLPDLAATLSIDKVAFSACIDSDKMGPRVSDDLEEAKAIGIPGTPFFFINEEPFPGTTVTDFETAIQAILKNK